LVLGDSISEVASFIYSYILYYLTNTGLTRRPALHLFLKKFLNYLIEIDV